MAAAVENSARIRSLGKENDFASHYGPWPEFRRGPSQNHAVKASRDDHAFPSIWPSTLAFSPRIKVCFRNKCFL